MIIEPTRMRLQLRFLRSDVDPEGAEILLAAIALGWCGVLAANPGALAAFPAYGLLQQVAPQSAWAIVCGLAGVLGVIAMLRQWLWVRVAVLTTHVFLWMMIGLSILSFAPNEPGWTVYLALALRSFWAVRQVVGRHRSGGASCQTG